MKSNSGACTYYSFLLHPYNNNGYNVHPCSWGASNRPPKLSSNTVILNSTGVLVGSSCFAYKTFHVLISSLCVLGGSVEVWTKNILYQFTGAKLIFSTANTCQEVLKWLWPQWTNIECSFFKPLNQLHACTENLPNMARNVCKTTSSRPELWFN